MKKIIIFVILIFISFILVACFKPIILRYLDGTARALKENSNYQLKIDDKSYNHCVYKSTESFDKKRHFNFLILYLKDLKIKTNFDVIIVNITEKVVGYPCSSIGCYDKLFGNLIQSEVGSFYTLLEDPYKGPGFNTNLKIKNQEIDFYIPSKTSKKLHIQLTKKLN